MICMLWGGDGHRPLHCLLAFIVGDELVSAAELLAGYRGTTVSGRSLLSAALRSPEVWRVLGGTIGADEFQAAWVTERSSSRVRDALTDTALVG